MIDIVSIKIGVYIHVAKPNITFNNQLYESTNGKNTFFQLHISWQKAHNPFHIIAYSFSQRIYISLNDTNR